MNRLFVYIFFGLLLLVIAAFWSLHTGVYSFSNSVISTLINLFGETAEISATDRYVLLDVRLPRIVMGIIIGSALAVSGTCMQGMFRNPLATPDFIGVTSGAILMAAITIVFGPLFFHFIPEYLRFFTLSVAAFLGAMATMAIVYRISSQNGKTDVVIMLLSGVAITSLAMAIVGFLIYMSNDEQLRDLTFWTLGSLGGATWTKNLILGILTVIAFFFLLNKGKALNAMMLGEKDAQHLGIPIERVKKQIMITVALIVGASVAFSGTIGFIGLIVPYILRLIFKSNYHYILPLSAIFGSVLLLVADTVSRTLVAPSEMPVGILTAFMGAPIFIIILMRFKKSMS
jgi:iron complex transport system permease protein